MRNDDLLVGRYRLERPIGRGGMAEVYLATDVTLGRRVAVKLLSSELATLPNFRTRFRLEAQAAARMNDPHIVALYDAGEQIGSDGSVRAFLVMEYVDGERLADRIARGPLAPAEAAEIMNGLLTALEYAHRAGVVHRDINPNNIMLTAGGLVKVMDFGIAQAERPLDDPMAQTTNILGTAAYFSPEQARGEVVDARSDLYSAACVLYEMLTGRPPFSGGTTVQVAYRHLSEIPGPPSVLNSAVSPDLDRVVLTALAKSKAERFQSAADFRAALTQAMVGDAQHPSTSPFPEPKAGLAGLRAAAGGPIGQLKPGGVRETGPIAKWTEKAGAVIAQSDAPLLGDYDPRDLNPAELALRQLALSGTERRQSRRAPLVWIWSGSLVLIALVAAVVLWVAAVAPNSNIPSTLRQVPSLAGLSKIAAEQALTGRDLVASIVERPSDTVSAGTVIESTPQAGEIVSKSTKVSVVVSVGKAKAAIPNLTNQALSSAQSVLVAAGFTPGSQTKQDSATVPAGAVIASSPAAGAKAEPGTTVDLIISTGKVTVPNVVGKPLAEATSLLSGTSVGLSVTPKPDTSCPLQTGSPVTAQSVRPGSVAQGSPVTLSFCAG